MNLVRAELARLFGRRFTKIMLGVVVLLLLVIGFGLASSSHKHNAQTRAQALAQIQQMRAQVQPEVDAQRADCEAAQRGEAVPNAPKLPPGFDCSQIQAPDFTPTEENLANFEPHQFVFRTDAADTLMVMGFLLALLGFAVGASFVGAEWSSGGMMNLLLWRPRRLQVLSTKLAALLVGLTVFTVLVSAAWTGLFVLTARLRGTLAGMTSGAWQSILLLELRGLVLVLAAGALGFGLASLGRHTAMALGAAIGTIIVFQFGLGTVLTLAKVPFVEAYLAPVWFQAWLDKSAVATDWNSCDFSSTAGCEPATLTITWPMAGGLLAAVVVLVVGAAMWTMRSRDIT